MRESKRERKIYIYISREREGERERERDRDRKIDRKRGVVERSKFTLPISHKQEIG